MRKTVFVITVCILSCIAWVVYSHDDQEGCYNTYQCRAIHAELTCHDFGAYGNAWVGGCLEVENDIYASEVDTDGFYGGNGFFGGCLTVDSDIYAGEVDAGGVHTAEIRLIPQEISLPTSAQNGDIFVRRYWAPDQQCYREDIAAYLNGAWRRVMTTDDWFGNP